MSFAESKINPAALYFNKRLLGSLPVILERPFTVVEAPMGYGKTLAVREFLHSALSTSDRLVWTAVLGGNENVFWQDFCRAFSAALPEAAKIAVSLANLGYPDDSTRLEAAWELLRRVDFPERTMIIVDDYHLLRNPGVGRLCAILARSAPANLHIVLITRNEYAGGKEILQLKGLMGYVGREAFALSRNEIVAYYACCGITLPIEDANILYARTSGWISALYLYLLRYIKNGVLEQPEALNALVEKEVFAPLSSATKNFLFALYPAERFTLEQAVFLDSSEETEDLLQELQHKNSFVTYDSVSRTFSLHSILRGFLKERFERLAISQQRAYNRRCGDWHLSRDEISSAVAAYYAAGDYEKSLQVMEEGMSNHMVAENAHLFVRFFKTCPEEILDRHVGAGFKYALAAFIANDAPTFAWCLDWLTKKCASLPYDDPESRVWRGELHTLHGLEAFNDIEAMGGHFRQAYAMLGGHTRLYGPKSSWSLGSPSVLFMFYRDSGGLWGNLEQLRRTLPDYHQLTQHHGASCAQIMEAEILFMRGDFAGAEILCHKAAAEAEKHEQLSMIFCILFLRIRLALMRADWPAVEGLLGEMRRMITKRPDYYLLHTVDLCKGAAFLALGRLDDMPEWLRRKDERRDRLYAVTSDYYYLVAGRAMLVNGEYTRVIGELDRLLEGKVRIRHCLLEIYACIYIAAAYHKLGNEGAARAALRQALKVALPDQVYMPFAANFDFLEPLLKAEAQGHEAHAEAFARIAELGAKRRESLQRISSEHFSFPSADE